MSNSGSESEFSDEEQGAQTFSIQPYQFEPQVNTDERDINTESLSGNESMEGSEELNPRLKNSDWYVLCSLLHCNSFTDLRNKLLFGPDVVFIIVSFSFFFSFWEPWVHKHYQAADKLLSVRIFQYVFRITCCGHESCSKPSINSLLPPQLDFSSRREGCWTIFSARCLVLYKLTLARLQTKRTAFL